MHVACHGSFESDDPMNSGLLLADSKVDASEIARSSLGLPGAYLEAGVKSVLVSISPAHDLVAPNFMGLYHKNRLEGKTPLVALQETQKTMLSTSKYPPYYWIGFTLYGCQ